MLKLTDEMRNEIALDILQGAIMTERMEKGMKYLLTAFSPKASEWMAADRHHGSVPAQRVLGVGGSIEEEPISNQLDDVFNKYLKNDFDKKLEDRKNANVLAGHILVEWKEIIKKVEFPFLQEKYA